MTETRDRSAVDQAEEVVNTAESRYVNALFVWEESARHRSEHCKCHQCQSEVARASASIMREIERIAPRDKPGSI